MRLGVFHVIRPSSTNTVKPGTLLLTLVPSYPTRWCTMCMLTLHRRLRFPKATAIFEAEGMAGILLPFASLIVVWRPNRWARRASQERTTQ